MARRNFKREAKRTFAEDLKYRFDWDVTALPEYVDDTAPNIMEDIVNGGTIKSLMSVMDNVKGKKTIKLASSNPALQAATACGWTPQNGIILTDEVIDTTRVKIQETYCNEELNDTWAQIENAAGANRQDEDPSFINTFANYYRMRAIELDENLIVNGDTASIDPSLTHYDGFVKLFANDGDVVSVPFAGALDNTNAFTALLDLYNGANVKVKSNLASTNARIICGWETARSCIEQIYNEKDYASVLEWSEENGSISFTLPTTNMTVTSIRELDGTDRAYLIPFTYLFYGTDLEGDINEFNIKWLEYDIQQLGIDMKWRSGIQYVFPEYFTKLDVTP